MENIPVHQLSDRGYDIEETIEGELISSPSWLDYIDLGLKALLVIAAFAIYTRL